MRWVLCAAVWQIAMVASLFVATTTDSGPVVARLWEGKPVHLGDVLVVFAGMAFATGVTGGMWVLESMSRNDVVSPPLPPHEDQVEVGLGA